MTQSQILLLEIGRSISGGTNTIGDINPMLLVHIKVLMELLGQKDKS